MSKFHGGIIPELEHFREHGVHSDVSTRRHILDGLKEWRADYDRCVAAGICKPDTTAERRAEAEKGWEAMFGAQVEAVDAAIQAHQARGYRRGRTDYAAIRDEANDPATEPVEVSMEEHDEMLGCVPPIYVPGGFLVGECSTGDERGDVYAHYAIRHGKAYARYAVRGRPETYIR